MVLFSFALLHTLYLFQRKKEKNKFLLVDNSGENVQYWCREKYFPQSLYQQDKSSKDALLCK